MDVCARRFNNGEPDDGFALLSAPRFERLASILGGTLPAMRDVHAVNAVIVVVANALAVGWGIAYVVRKRTPGRIYAHLLAAGQALLIGQVAVGLLLLSDGHRTGDELHYLYGVLALVAVLSPWLYAPPVPARRLLWFVGATVFATALAVRAYVTAS